MRSGRVRGGYDLHVHTTHSDGACSPGEVVRNAAVAGLAGLAVTDHDTISGLDGAHEEASRLGIDLVSGIELSVRDGAVGRHLLGLGFNPDDGPLLGALARYRESRGERAAEIGRRLEVLGYRVDWRAIGRRAMRAVPGRRHFAAWLVESGQLPDRRAAFRGLLEEGGAAFVAFGELGIAEAIELVGGAGGVSVLAHPGRELRRADLEHLAGLGLGGIEVGFPGVPRQRRERLEGWARELGLIGTAGSDFHAPDAPGRWVGAIRCEAAVVAAIRRRGAGLVGGRSVGDDGGYDAGVGPG